MKLNADIIFERIKKYFPGEIYGYRSSELTLRRPEFFVEGTTELKTGHVYLLTKDQFPRHLNIEKGCVIICHCNVPNFSYYTENACIIKLNGSPDIFAVTNTLNNIYEMYSNWDHKLSALLETSADIDEMTSITSDIFGDAVLVLDSNFSLVAASGYTEQSMQFMFGKLTPDKLSMEALNEFLQSKDMSTTSSEPMHFFVGQHEVLAINLFELEEYAGSVTFDYTVRSFVPGDEALIKHFSHYIMLAMKRYTSLMTSNRSVARQILEKIVNERPVDDELKRQLSNMNLKSRWICLVYRIAGQVAKIPVSYLCENMESYFPSCIAFVYKDNIVSFIAFDESFANKSLNNILEDQLGRLLSGDDLKIGISSDFDNPYMGRLYYNQAFAALENGTLLNPDEHYYYFKDYALVELIINAQNNLPLEMYYSEGLSKLFEHDSSSATSYVETLRCYLNNNMSVTATSAELHIHRSTLLERLARIKRELWEDLEDPDVRLRLMIVLKALEMREKYTNYYE